MRSVREGAREITYVIPPVINPDEIAQHLSPGDPDAAASEAAREALRRRIRALSNRESFAIETTLSGHSELRLIDEARAAGYRITMTFVALDSAQLNVERVDVRARIEHRTVPAADVLRRYDRSLENLARVIDRIDATYVYDNTGRDLAAVAMLEHGRVVTMAEHVPNWAERALGPQLHLARDRADIVREAAAQLRAAKATTLTSTIGERPVSATSTIRGRVIAASAHHVAIATSVVTFGVVERVALDRDVAVGQQISLTMRQGHGMIELIARSQDRGGRSR